MICPENYKEGLILIPTPIDEALPLEPLALAVLEDAAKTTSTLILVEELKAGRIRWLQWGLPRESIDRFIAYNEHTEKELYPKITQALKEGGRALIMSDGGLPAFCDPGQRLVDACHDSAIKVTATPFPHSIALALALSGFDHGNYFFAGFLPAQSEERKRSLEHLFTTQKSSLILMDTPYRMRTLIQSLAESSFRGRRAFLATGLNSAGERLLRGKPSSILDKLGDLEKAEFVIVIEGALKR